MVPKPGTQDTERRESGEKNIPGCHKINCTNGCAFNNFGMYFRKGTKQNCSWFWFPYIFTKDLRGRKYLLSWTVGQTLTSHLLHECCQDQSVAPVHHQHTAVSLDVCLSQDLWQGVHPQTPAWPEVEFILLSVLLHKSPESKLSHVNVIEKPICSGRWS